MKKILIVFIAAVFMGAVAPDFIGHPPVADAAVQSEAPDQADKDNAKGGKADDSHSGHH